ncbi:uncharacterized protein LOC107459209 [Arachis duranensis]|uniref:Uncharacterized protein LOC107459209 n=1 Tax=Arachis duranensis TaxID=130453 RepID=A0A6P4B2N3_ARADU|nr:uncharacterized protein LOC107459209 [Arachis duranensis]
MFSVKTYSIRHGVEYKVLESDHHKYYGKCKEFGNGCACLVRVSLRQRKGIWEIKWYNGPHIYLATSISSDHRKLDYHVKSAFILPMIRAYAATSIKVLQNATKHTLALDRRTGGFGWPNRRSCHKFIETGKSRTMTCHDGYWVCRLLCQTFSPCVEVFRHCKPLVGVDGTHLYGKYGGKLLVAIEQDGNSNIIPIAFALVEDRYNGIKTVLEAPDSGWLPPTAYRAFCIRHVVGNFTLTFKGKDARRLLVNAAYAKTEVKFHYWFDILYAFDPAMCHWANRIDYAH